MTGPRPIADRTALRLHRTRAARAPIRLLQNEAASEIEERLAEVNRTFTAPAIVGAAGDVLARAVPSATCVEDTERIALRPAAHDLVLHFLNLHWADDPVGQLVQSRLSLVPDGMLLAVAFGGQTLHELRSVLAEAETRLTGGLSPRVLPMADVRALGDLLARAGLAMPVADSRKLRIRYPGLAALARDLRGMGETNALAERRRTVPPRRLFQLAEELYRTHFGDDEGNIHATFELVFLTGWAPADGQPKPLRPGSAATRLADALGVEERSAGDPAAPRSR